MGITGESLTKFAKDVNYYLNSPEEGWKRYAYGMIRTYQNVYGVALTIKNNRLCIRGKHLIIGSRWGIRDIASWEEEFLGKVLEENSYFIIGKVKVHKGTPCW